MGFDKHDPTQYKNYDEYQELAQKRYAQFLEETRAVRDIPVLNDENFD